MNHQEQQEPAPHGSEEAQTVDLGEPEHEDAEADEVARAERAEERPNLDEREARISTERKPMGPPLEAGENEHAPAAEEQAPEPPGEPPTEPDEP